MNIQIQAKKRQQQQQITNETNFKKSECRARKKMIIPNLLRKTIEIDINKSEGSMGEHSIHSFISQWENEVCGT